jgi:uncharacterized protein
MRLALLLCLLSLSACASPPREPQPVEPIEHTPAVEPGGMTPAQAWQHGMELRDRNELEEALEFMLSAAERGHREAQFEIGLWYMTGNRGLPLDFNKAAPWIEKAAEQGQLDALSYIWQLHFYGTGVPQSDARALQWLQRGAGAGNAMSAYYLGLFHYEGIATEVDRAEAAVWFLDAADAGIGGASYYLGVMHLEGDGVQQGDEDAFYWFKRGAEGRHPASMLATGDMYAQGKGVRKNLDQARSWYRKAVAQTEDTEVQSAAAQRLRDLEKAD